MSSTTPLSGWLNKLATANTFGNCRWQSRYFVLLDSEMRYYKGEHATNASRTINLRDVSKVTVTSTPNHPYCFKLEPTLYYQSLHPTMLKSQRKIWTMKCQSQYELDSWIEAINTRLLNLCLDQTNDVVSPSLQPFSTAEQNRQQPLVSLSRAISATSSSSESSNSDQSTVSTSTATANDIDYLQCKPQARPMSRSRPTISRRRGILLSRIDICTIPGLELSDMLSSASSKGSCLSSPAKDTCDLDEEEDFLHSQQANKLTVHNAYVLDTSSPNFAIYKGRYNV